MFDLYKLIGYKVVSPIKSDPEDDGTVYTGLLLTKDGNDIIVWALRDEEGNGAGTFELEPVTWFTSIDVEDE